MTEYLTTMIRSKLLIICMITLLLPGYGSWGEANAREKLITVISSAFSKPDEQKYIREKIIPEFEKKSNARVQFHVLSPEDAFDKLRIQKKAGRINTDVVIAYVSRFSDLVQEGLVSEISEDRTYAAGFLNLGKFKGKLYFIPMLGDSYLLVANKKSLKYLTKNLKYASKEMQIRNITWEELVDWNDNIKNGTGKGKFALPGARGNLLTYIIGCAILSYGGSFPDVVSDEAVSAWRMFASLKEYVNPSFSSYKEIVSPMKREETWIGVTHSARANQVFLSDTEKYVLAPVPCGPAGRGCIVGSYGLGVINGTKKVELAREFIRFITSPKILSKIVEGTGFTPAVKEALQFIGGDSPRYRAIEESLRIFDSGKISYIPPARRWGRVKAAFEDTYYQMVLGKKTIDKEYLRKQQRIIDEELF